MEKSGSIQLPSVTVIIPAYNEQERIGSVLDELSQYIELNKIPWNIIVSIDGNDNTENIVKKYSEKYDFIFYDKKGGRSGKGKSIKRVVPRASGEFVLLMDADGSIKFSEILKNLHYTKNYDMIIFNRYSDPENEIPLRRKVASRGFNTLVKALLGIKIRDTQCGYKIIKTDLIKRVFETIQISNAFFDIPLLYNVKERKGKIIEVGVRYIHDKKSKFNVISGTVGLGLSLLAFKVRHSRFYKYVPEWAKVLYYRKFRWI